MKKIIYFYFIKLIPKIFINFFQIYKYKLNLNIEYLLDKGIKIDNIYDIGAFHGEWSEFLNNTSLKKKKFFLFEANKKHVKKIKNKNFPYFIGILSNIKKRIKFYSKNHSGDSYYLELTSFYKENLKPKILEANTLDNIVNINKLLLPDLIKIDTQGSEIDILKGAQKTISNCSVIYIECPIVDYNYNAPNFNDYINYLNKIGFAPYDICEIHHIDNVLVQVDIMFLKKKIIKKLLPKKPILKLLS